jgi:23S rRNA (cytidine1920-2'-O)/16S rRNA (cytidine1409-2'-O)-methyltransferase
MSRFASRSGLKLQAALEAWDLPIAGSVCVDFGANVGGFTDCLLQAGASKVYAIDTGYGQLAWKLRTDDRVVVMERTNALHCDVAAKVDFAVIDVAWTPQKRIVPVALDWLGQAGEARRARGRIISLLKPHYELDKLRGRKPRSPLTDEQLAQVELALAEQMAQVGARIVDRIDSPIAGKGGNVEKLLLIEPLASTRPEPDRQVGP